MNNSTLTRIANLLNAEGILWAVGGSLVLNHHGLGNPANDIDLLVHLKDIEKVDAILSTLGEKTSPNKNGTYATRHFFEYVIGDTEIDVICGLMINHGEGCYTYLFQEDSLDETVGIGSASIPLMALEDWYVLYQLIPGREPKADLIEDYLRTHGISRPELLARACRGDLPDTVRARIERLIL